MFVSTRIKRLDQQLSFEFIVLGLSITKERTSFNNAIIKTEQKIMIKHDGIKDQIYPSIIEGKRNNFTFQNLHLNYH